MIGSTDVMGGSTAMVTTWRRWLVLAAIWAVMVVAMPPSVWGQDVPGGLAKVVVEESFLHWMARASGKLGIVLLAMSFYLIALIAWMTFEYRRSLAMPQKLIDDVAEMLAARQYTEAFQRVSADKSFLARVLAAGVKKLPSGMPGAPRRSLVMVVLL